MKKKWLFIFLFILAMLAISVHAIRLIGQFGPGVADYSFVVTDDIRLVRSSASNRRLIVCVGLDRNGKSMELPPGDIVFLGWDKRFIVCAQRDTQFDSRYGTIYAHGPEKWWIVDMKEARTAGPLSLDEVTNEGARRIICPPILIYPVEVYGRDGLIDTNTANGEARLKMLFGSCGD